MSILCCDPIFVLPAWASREKLCQPYQPVQNAATTSCGRSSGFSQVFHENVFSHALIEYHNSLRRKASRRQEHVQWLLTMCHVIDRHGVWNNRYLPGQLKYADRATQTWPICASVALGATRGLKYGNWRLQHHKFFIKVWRHFLNDQWHRTKKILKSSCLV